MTNNFTYNGKVTLRIKHKDKILIERLVNNGTNDLFKAYAMALAGQDITQFLPTYIDVVDNNSISCLTTNGVSVNTIYGANEELYNGVPYTRVSANITGAIIANTSVSRLKLRALNGLELASVDISALSNIFGAISSGTQLLIVWDLYITNDNE